MKAKLVIGLVVIAVLAAGAFVWSKYANQAPAIEPVSSNPLLEQEITTTTKTHTPLLQKPKGWRTDQDSDSAYFSVSFHNDKGASINYNSQQDRGESLQERHERWIYEGGTSIQRIIIEQKKVMLGSVPALMTEWESSSPLTIEGEFVTAPAHHRIYMFSVGTRMYALSVKSKTEEWSNYLPTFEASIATVQIPKE